MPGAYVCPTGYLYYSCHSNDFQGCCSVNPCSLQECPSPIPELSELDSTSSDSDSPSTMVTTTMTSPDSTPSSSDSPSTTMMTTMTSPDSTQSSSDSPSTMTTTTMTSPDSTPSSPPSALTTIRTDSGITHTVPNNAVVTITKHTVVFSEAPLSTESSTVSTSTAATASSIVCSTCFPASTTISSGPSMPNSTGGLSSGAIAGAATGGAVILIIVVFLICVSRNRWNQQCSRDASETETLGGELNPNAFEKSNASSNGRHVRSDGDPFAPFGGRVDQPEQINRPPSQTFEMDGTGLAAVELPAISISEAPNTTVKASHDVSPTSPTATDPAATLASLANSQGKTSYVNQWNHYKVMASRGDIEHQAGT